MEKLKRTFNEIGVAYQLTDDSEESGPDESLDTVIVVKDGHKDTLFMFHEDGSFKEVMVFG